MKKAFVFILSALYLTACQKKSDDKDGIVCTAEFRMITLTVSGQGEQSANLDSSYTVRVSTQAKLRPTQQAGNNKYVVLDDSYHTLLKNSQENFRFVGWKNNQIVVDELYTISGDNCHISKKSGADTVAVVE